MDRNSSLRATRALGRRARLLLHFDLRSEIRLAATAIADVLENGDRPDHLLAVSQRPDVAALRHHVERETGARRWHRQQVRVKSLRDNA